MTYNNITITESENGFSIDTVNRNWLRPNTFRKDTVTNSLATIKATITYYLNNGAVSQNGILYIAKEAN